MLASQDRFAFERAADFEALRVNEVRREMKWVPVEKWWGRGAVFATMRSRPGEASFLLLCTASESLRA